MKTNFTFDELSKIFSAIVKIDSAATTLIEIEKVYEEKDHAFDDEFAKYGYTFFRAPDELHEMFDEKVALSDKRDAAQRKVRKLVKEFAAMVGIGEGIYEYEEDEIKKFIASKRYFEVEKIVRYCKWLAQAAARYLIVI